MRREFSWLAMLPAILLVGCGGGGGGSSSDPTEPTEIVEEGTAKFSVDVLSGNVGVKSLTSGSRAVLGGQAVTFEATSLLDEGGEVGRRAFKVKLKNNLSESIGVGRPIRVHFGVIGAAGAYNSDLRANSEVSSPIPPSPHGSGDGAAGVAELNEPNAVTVSPDGTIYFNGLDGRIRRLKEGYVSTVAINVPCTGLLYMQDAATGREFLLATSPTLHSVKIITIASGSVGTWAGLDNTSGNVNGTPSAARFNTPSGLALDPYRSQILIADTGNSAVRAINFSWSNGGLVANTVAARYGGLSQPIAVAVSTSQTVGIVEQGAHRIRTYHNGGSREALFGGTAGDAVGDGNLARFDSPKGIAAIGESFFVTDRGNARVKRIALKPGAAPLLSTSWTVSYVAGSTFGYQDGTGSNAQFGGVHGIAIDNNSRIVVSDVDNNSIRRVTSQSAFDFGSPDGSASGSPSLANYTGFTDQGGLRRPYIDIAQTVAPGQIIDAGEWQFAIPSSVKAFSFVVHVETGTSVFAPLEGTYNAGVGSENVEVKLLSAQFSKSPAGKIQDISTNGTTFMDRDAQGNFYMAEYASAIVRRIDPQGNVSLVAGRMGVTGTADGTGETGRLSYPSGVKVNAEGTEIIVTETFVHLIRRISLTPGTDPAVAANWNIKTLGGGSGAGFATGDGTIAKFIAPNALDGPNTNELYFADTGNQCIRSMIHMGGDRNDPANWRFDVLAGSTSGGYADGFGVNAKFATPFSVAYSPERFVYVADRANYRVRKIDIASLQVTTVAGDGVDGNIDHQTDPLQARIGLMTHISLDPSGALFIGTTNRLRKLQGNSVSTVAGGGFGTGTSGATISLIQPNLYAQPNGDLVGVGTVSGYSRIMRVTRRLGR